MHNNFNNIDKNTLDAAKRGDVNAVFKNIDAEDKKIEQVLADKNKLKQILSSDAAQQLIKILGGDKRMDDISEKLAEILNNPDSLSRVREMAENILGNNKSADETPKNNRENSVFNEDFDPVQIGKIISIVSRLKNECDDNRAKLLLALKPHLSAPRRQKIDTAIKLLKLLDLLPLLRENGIFEI